MDACSIICNETLNQQPTKANDTNTLGEKVRKKKN